MTLIGGIILLAIGYSMHLPEYIIGGWLCMSVVLFIFLWGGISKLRAIKRIDR